MKKFLLLLMSAMICTMAFADDIILTPKPGNGNGGNGNKTITLYPTVSYDNSAITIYAPYYIDSMTVLIADSNEDEIYTVQLGGFIGQQPIALPADVDADKYSIYLYFNDICLYGLF